VFDSGAYLIEVLRSGRAPGFEIISNLV
jgi:hypothetical protein